MAAEVIPFPRSYVKRLPIPANDNGELPPVVEMRRAA